MKFGPNLSSFFLLLAATRTCTAQKQSNSSVDNEITSQHKDFRLPTTLKPHHYFIRLQPFLGTNFTTHGYLEVTFQVAEPTSIIILHMKNIVTQNDTVKVVPVQSGPTQIKILSQKYDPARAFYLAALDRELEKGEKYILKMSFVGSLSGLKGFYPSYYLDESGNKKWLAATQFQATDARRAFPCFDEPGFKASFTIELLREEGMTSLSNMPKIRSSPLPDQPGWYADRFSTSVPMSTYLVAFLISDFEHLNSSLQDDTRFRVWARKSHIGQAKYALEKGHKILKFYEKYFQIKFPLPKLDMVAIPDFGPGAMENWGLVNYREFLMLYDPERSAASIKNLVGNVVAHELAHQWFGDIVTPTWWTDIWLNEGFANYMQAVAFDAVEPDFKVLDQLLVKAVHPAMEADSLINSHAINIPIVKAEEMQALNPKITYDKGASLLRMLANFLTEQTFKQGLTNYMNSFVYSNAEQSDLWRYLSDQASVDNSLPEGLTVKDIMDTWTLQMGYPLLQVQLYDNGTVHLTQERFLSIQPPENHTDTHDYKWFIPITKSTKSAPDFLSTNPKLWMSPTEEEKTIAGFSDPSGWTIVNNLQSGFYRVNYDTPNWNKLTKQLKKNHTVIHPMNRAQITGDSFQLAKGGYISYAIPLQILPYLKKEREFVPLSIAISEIKFVEKSLIGNKAHEAFKRFLLSILSPLYNDVGFKDDLTSPHLEQRKRPLVLEMTCRLGHAPCLQVARERLQNYMKNSSNENLMSPNLKSLLYCYGIQEGTEAQWNFAWQKFLQTSVTSEKNLLLSALGCTQNPTLRSRYLSKAFSGGSEIRKQDAGWAFSSICRDRSGSRLAWNFLKKNWRSVYDYVDDIRATAYMIRSATKFFYTPDELKEVKDFIDSRKEFSESGTRLVDQAIEAIEGLQKWRLTNVNSINKWLNEKALAG